MEEVIVKTRGARAVANLRDMNEYRLIIAPDVPVAGQVMEEKEWFRRSFPATKISPSRPLILVSGFMARDEMEDTMIRWLQRIVGEQRSFAVTLNNYSGFPPHTIFLRVQNPLPFQELARQLKPIDYYIRSNACPAPTFVSRPYLSIAGELPASIYEKAIQEYAQKFFHASFMASELFLLRRRNDREPCKQMAVLRMQP